MRYFGTHFSLTLAGLRLRVRIDLDDSEPEPQDVQPPEGTPQHVDVHVRPIPHHVRSRRA
jgi:hypothetical protein